MVLGTFGYEPIQVPGQDSDGWDYEVNPGGPWEGTGDSDHPSLSSSDESPADELEEELEGAPEDVDYILEDAI
jgi:hypothetical protein